MILAVMLLALLIVSVAAWVTLEAARSRLCERETTRWISAYLASAEAKTETPWLRAPDISEALSLEIRQRSSRWAGKT
jgi:hypothetical protein